MSRWLRHIPNLISCARILLALPIAASLLEHRYAGTAALFCLAALSDAADGFLARHCGWQSAVGGMLDAIADKLMLATVFVTLAVLGLTPVWLTAAVVGRDVIIVLGAVAYRICFGPIEARPSNISKLNTLCQMAFILAVIGREQFSLPPAWLIVLLGAATFVTVSISGIDYVMRYGRLALDEARARRDPWRSTGSKLT